MSNNILSYLVLSAVHQTRRGEPILFAGAGVCSNYCRTLAKKPESIDEKVNTRIDTA
jgi:hypothetical protein